jgi:DinB superfamily
MAELRGVTQSRSVKPRRSVSRLTSAIPEFGKLPLSSHGANRSCRRTLYGWTWRVDAGPRPEDALGALRARLADATEMALHGVYTNSRHLHTDQPDARLMPNRHDGPMTTDEADTGGNITIDWNYELAEQLDWHWREQLRPRFEGITDEEYFWEPVPGCWNVRPRGQSNAPVQAGSGDFTIDFAFPEPEPAPVTTIAWRLGHILVGVLGSRIASHFGGRPVEYMTYDYPGTAAEALRRLDEYYAEWTAGVRGLGSVGLARPCGPAEGPFAEYPIASLVLHINREMLHHGAEVALLRDLFAHRR